MDSETETIRRGNSNAGVLSSVKTTIDPLNLNGEPVQRENKFEVMLRMNNYMDESQELRQARSSAAGERGRITSSNRNTARGANKLRFAHPGIGPALQGQQKQHSGALQAI